MIRIAASLAVGGLLGAGAVYAVLGARGGLGSGPLVEGVADLTHGLEGRGAGGAVTTAESHAIYRAIASETSRADLEAALRSAAAAAPSPTRDLEIDGLLARLAELAPAEAPGFARALALETRFLADAYVYLAAADPAAAIRELAAIESRSRRIDIALALLEVVGDDNAGLERVAAGLAGDDRDRLRVAWIAFRADEDPYRAFREAELLGPGLAGDALERIGAAWAARDPLGAVTQAELLAEPEKERYLASVFDEWSRLDPAGFLSWLGSVPSPHRRAWVTLESVATSHPDLVIGVVDNLPGNLGEIATSRALYALAEADPDAALARLDGMPAGPERDTLLAAIGTALARRDPDTALAWAETLDEPPQELMNQLTTTIAFRHPERAVEFLENPPLGVDQGLMVSIVTSAMARDSETARALADRLVAADSIESANALRNLLSNWMAQDPERALDWVLAREDQINATVLSNAAGRLARADPVTAAAYLERIPAAYRAAWIGQVAAPYGIADPAGALAWVSRFQGEDIYDDALLSVIAASAQIDARAAAAELSQANAAVQAGAAPRVATLFAAEDPFAATRWAENLSDQRARAGAVGAAVSVWSDADFAAAQSYTLGLDRGEMRDQALNALILRAARSGRLDPGLLDGFASDRALEQTLLRAIPMIAQQDPEQADALLERVTSGEARRLIEEQIAAQPAAPGFIVQ